MDDKSQRRGEPVDPYKEWTDYAKRSGLLNDDGIASEPARAQTAWNAFSFAWNRSYRANVAPQPAEPVKVPSDGEDHIASEIAQGKMTREEFLEARKWVRDTYYPVAAQPHLYDGDTLTAAYMAGQDSTRPSVPEGWRKVLDGLTTYRPAECASGVSVVRGGNYVKKAAVIEALSKISPTRPADEHRLNHTVEPKLDTLPVTPEEEEAWQQLEDK